jgi:hypothetical protein
MGVKVTIKAADNAAPGNYAGEIYAIADKCPEEDEGDGASDYVPANYNVSEAYDLDIDNNDQDLVANAMSVTLWIPPDSDHEPLTDAQMTEATLYYTVVNPGPQYANVDAEDGPGNAGLSNLQVQVTFNQPQVAVTSGAQLNGAALPFNSAKVGALNFVVSAGAAEGTYTGTVQVSAGSQQGNPATVDQFDFSVTVKMTEEIQTTYVEVVDMGATPNPVYPEDGSVDIYIPTEDCQTFQILIYSLSGVMVKDFGEKNCADITGTLEDHVYTPDPAVTWDLKNDSDELVASGMYVVVVKYDGERDIKRFKIMVIR